MRARGPIFVIGDGIASSVWWNWGLVGLHEELGSAVSCAWQESGLGFRMLDVWRGSMGYVRERIVIVIGMFFVELGVIE